MKVFTETLLHNLKQQLNFLHLELHEPIRYSEEAINIIMPAFEKLQAWCIKYTFSKEEEITFFRRIKPQFTSKLIYYNTIYTIESNKPVGSKPLRRYYKAERDKRTTFLKENSEFYRYYRCNGQYLDHKYFLRGNLELALGLDNTIFHSDRRFSTSHDHLLSLIMAHEQVIIFLEETISKLKNKRNHFEATSRTLKWTGSKVGIIELIYALQTEGVFNHGTTDLKEIISFFSKSFDIDLAQFHRTYFEICSRKSDRTKFLRSLNKTLERRMDEADKFQ